MRAAILIAAILVVPAARADERGPTVAIALGDCPTLDGAAILRLVSMELPRDLVRIDAGDPGGFPDVELVVAAACDAVSDVVRIHLPRDPAAPARAESLADVAPALRSRTLALALAETVRRARQKLPPAPEPEPPPPVIEKKPVLDLPAVAKPAPLPPGRFRDERRMRVSGYTALGLAGGTVSLVVVGVSLVAAGGAQKQPGLTVPGAALLGISSLTFAGTVTAFGLWAHERRKPVAAGLAPLPGGGMMLAAMGEF